MSFSVIIPVYQAEKYLKRCLESLRIQSYSDFEVIMVDDGSTDHSYDICQYFQAKDNRFRSIHQENRGVSNARNTGLRLAEKDYILFVDADDYVEKDYLKSFQSALRDESDICIGTKYYTIKERQIKVTEVISYEENYKIKEKEELLDRFLNREINLPYAVCLNCYRRKFLLENKIWFEEAYSHGEDTDFFLQAFFCVNSYTWLGEAVYFYYRDNEDSATYKVSVKSLRSHFEFYKKWYYIAIQRNEIYQNWARYLSDSYAFELLEGVRLSRKERKQILDRDKRSIEFYQGASSRLKRTVMKLYLIFGYENMVPIVTYLFRIKQKWGRRK